MWTHDLLVVRLWLPLKKIQWDFISSSEAAPEVATTKGKGTRHSSEPRKVAFFSGSSDEDPYSLTASGSSGSSRKDQKNKLGLGLGQAKPENPGSRMDHYATQERGSRMLLSDDTEAIFAQNWAKVSLSIPALIIRHCSKQSSTASTVYCRS